MGINGHQISISQATVHIWVLKDTKAVYHYYGTDMGIKGHQISISLATVQTWVLKTPNQYITSYGTDMGTDMGIKGH